MQNVENQPVGDQPKVDVAEAEKEPQDISTAIALPDPLSTTPTGPDLGQILLPVILRWWFLLVIPLVCGGIGYYLVGHNTTYYQGRMLMGVGPAVKDIQIDVPELLNLRLTASYIQLVANDRFLQMVAQQSHSKLDLDSLRQSIVASAVKGTPYFEFQIVGTDSDEILRVLASIRDLLMDQSPQTQELRNQTQQAFLSARRQELQNLIQTRNQELSSLQNNPGSGPNAATGVNATTRSTADVKSELDAYTTELTEISQYNTTNVINQLHVVENPHLLIDKLGAQPKDGAVALAAIGLALVIILVWLVEKYDPRLRYRYQVRSILSHSVLQVVKNGRKKKGRSGPNQLELVTAELLVRANQHGLKDPPRCRVLFLVENNCPKPENSLQDLAVALVGLGINCSVRDGLTGETIFFKLPEKEPGFGSTAETSLARSNFENNATKVSWELINLKWPVAQPIAVNLARQADDLVVLCSLNKSSKQSLYKLENFLTRMSGHVAGVLLV